jgi:hypothetical protein
MELMWSVREKSNDGLWAMIWRTERTAILLTELGKIGGRQVLGVYGNSILTWKNCDISYFSKGRCKIENLINKKKIGLKI